MGDRFSELSANLAELFRRRARRFKRASFFVKFMLLAVASAVVSMMQFLQIPESGSLTTVQAAGIVGSLLVFAGAVFTLISEEDTTEELVAAREATEAVREMQKFIEQFSTFETANERAVQLYQSSMVFRGVVERVGMARGSLAQLLGAFMTTSKRSLPIAMGFEAQDIWTICIYQAVSDAQSRNTVLRCVAHNRAIDCDVTQARLWPEGVGVVGISYANQKEVIIRDMRNDNLGSMLQLASGSKDYDDDRYRSIVAVPVRVDGQTKPWGVVVATSDRPSHFSPDDGSGPKTHEPVRLLAAMVALAVVMCDRGTPTPTGQGGQPSTSRGVS